jgi:Protein of unknown function (DUF3617)
VRKIAPAAVLCLVLTAAPALFAQQHIKPGQWEITSSMEMEGMAHQMQPMSFTHCFKAGDTNPKSIVQEMHRRNQECKIEDLKENGNKVSWTMKCHSERGEDVMATGEMTYRPDSYEGTMHMEMSGGPHGTMKMTQHIKARRLGDCK